MRGGVRFHFFSTLSPCGDASIYQKVIAKNASTREISFITSTWELYQFNVLQQGCDDDGESDPKRRRLLDQNRTGAKCLSGQTQERLFPN